MKKKPQAKQQGKPVKAGLNFSEKRRLAELKRTLAGNDKKQEKPTTAQNTITFKKMFRDGICQVTSTYYTKMVEFFDINYDLLEIEDQGEILEEYSKFINYFDPSIKFQLFLFNRQVNEQTLIDQFDIPLQGDDFDDIREEYSEMLKKQAAKGNNGIIKSKYLIFGTECKGFKEAKSKLNNIEADGVDFYAARDKKVSTMLNYSYADWNFSDSEKAFWQNRVSSVKTPYEYGYHAGWKLLLSCMELFVVGILGICICVSGTFSGEYQSGAASVILSSRYGKSKLVKAKIFAAFVYSLSAFTLFILVGCGIQLAAFGVDGWNLPIQVLSSIAPYRMSLLSAALIAVATLYLILLGMVSFTLLLSAKMKSSVPVLVMIILVSILPMFLGISETSGIWNRILVLLPYRATQPVFSDEFIGYFGYPLGGMTFDIVTVRMIVYAVIMLVCIPFARRAWKKHQVA